ncbi:MAG TPA: bifunctional DNA primase/polymerase [Acetobacteraceae bacterium]|nr:bifunctional DNA primase/polymerase [Acetobacteraceae bacterium]
MSPIARAALAYSERLGLSVIPTGEGCKPGSVKKFGALLEAAKEAREQWFRTTDGTKDPALIRAIWTRFPRANVSICTGRVSGVFALDIDAKDGKVDGFGALAELEERYGALPRSWRALTPSGGEHRYFRQPDGWDLRNKVGLRLYDSGARVSEVFNGLDIRTDGGACAAPPSVKASGSYRWADHPLEVEIADAPLWLLKMALDPPPPPKADRAPLRRESADRMARYVEKALDNECARVAGTKSGRNVQLFKSAANLGSLVGADLLPQQIAEDDLFRAADSCGLVHDDGAHSVRSTIASGMRAGIAKPREVRA